MTSKTLTPSELSDARSAVARLRDDLVKLSELVQRHATDASLMVLPLPTDQPHPGSTEMNEADASADIEIIPEYVVGSAAIAQGAQSYRVIEKRPEQPPDKCFRIPGVIAMPSHEVCDLALSINNQKDALKERMKSLAPNRDGGRGHLLSNLPIRHLHLRQAYRHIPVFPQRVDRISFTWVANPISVTRITVGQVRDWLSTMAYDESSDFEPAWEAALRGLEDREILARRRKLLPSPSANIKGFTDDTGHLRDKRMSIVIPALHYGESLPDIRPLKRLPAPEDRKTKTASAERRKLEWDPLIGALGIYRYQPLYRQYR